MDSFLRTRDIRAIVILKSIGSSERPFIPIHFAHTTRKPLRIVNLFSEAFMPLSKTHEDQFPVKQVKAIDLRINTNGVTYFPIESWSFHRQSQ
jgi:hypothetical protein